MTKAKLDPAKHNWKCGYRDLKFLRGAIAASAEGAALEMAINELLGDDQSILEFGEITEKYFVQGLPMSLGTVLALIAAAPYVIGNLRNITAAELESYGEDNEDMYLAIQMAKELCVRHTQRKLKK